MDVFRIKEGDYETKLKLVRNLCYEKEFLSPQFLYEAWNSFSQQEKNQLSVSLNYAAIKRFIKVKIDI